MKNKYKVAAVLAVLFSVSAVATPVAVHAQYAGTSVIVQQTSQEFIFNYNPVSRVQGEIAIDETTFPDQNFRKWVTNNLSADGIKLTADEITNATDIDVSNQNISDLTGIEYFTELWWLNCSGNQLTTLDVSRNPDLYDLDCSNNQLTTLNINGAVVLENLNCSNNRLTTLNLSDNTALASLHCSGNQLTALDVRQKPLEVLDCSNNQLLSLNLMENDRLYLLRVNSNKLVCLNLRDAVYDEIALNNQLPNTITVENGIYDLTQLAAEINGDKITVTSGADQNGTILNNLTADTVVTYTYDCGSGQTLTVTLNVAQQEQLANSWITPLSITDWTYGEPANAPTATAQYGQPSYTYSQNVNGPYGALPAQPNAGIWYVKATVAPGVDYLGLESDPVAFTIAKAVAPAVVFPSDLSAVAMNPLSSVELPQGWSWADATQILRVNQTDYIARYEVDGMNYDYAGIAGYNAQGNYIEVLLPVSVRKAVAPAIELPDNLTAVNGSVLSTVVLPAGWTWVVDTQQMVSPTNYSFSARLTVDDVNYDYTGVIGYNADGHYVESVLSLNIAAFENIWITPLSITGWAYGEPTNAPIAKAQYGNVMFTYSDAIDGVFTAIVPTQPGTWYVKATVAGTTDYNGLEAIAEFTIAPKVKKINNTSTGDVTNVGLWSSIFGTTGALFVGLLAFLKGKRSKDKVK